MLITKDEIRKLLTIAGEAKAPIQFVAGVRNNVGSLKYFIKEIPDIENSMLYFLKAVPYTPNFYKWPMSFDRDRLGGNEKMAEMCDISTYSGCPDRTKIFKDLLLNMQRDFILRSTPFPLPQLNLITPRPKRAARSEVAMDFVGSIPVPFGSDVSFDSFLDRGMINNLMFAPSDHPRGQAIYPEKAIGYVVFSNPLITKPIKEAKVFYYNPFGFVGATMISSGRGGSPSAMPEEPQTDAQEQPQEDQATEQRYAPTETGKDLTDLFLFFRGINPRKNPMLKKLSAFELARMMKRDGFDLREDNGSLILFLRNDERTVNGFGSSLVKWFKKMGQKIEKGVTTPIRNYLKSKTPGVWSVIDTVDKKIGLNKIMKKYSVQLEEMAKKYGDKLMESGLMAAAAGAASYVGIDPNVAKQYTSIAINTAEALDGGDKSKLVNMAANAFNPENINKQGVVEVAKSLFTGIEKEMVKERGTEGVKDFKNFMSIAKDIYSEGKKEVENITKQEPFATKIEPVIQSTDVAKMFADMLSKPVNLA